MAGSFHELDVNFNDLDDIEIDNACHITNPGLLAIGQVSVTRLVLLPALIERLLELRPEYRASLKLGRLKGDLIALLKIQPFHLVPGNGDDVAVALLPDFCLDHADTTPFIDGRDQMRSS
jgi:hypothetical protein